jgi:L-histidine Nalpha-methyltransferase
MSQFLNDVLAGLSAKEKYLSSKYFYDKRGDELFQKIMA